MAVAMLLGTIASAASPASAAGLIVSPLNVAFGNLVFGVTGATSTAKTVKITNPLTGQPVTGLSIQLSGADPGDFAIASNTCGSTLAKGTFCSVTITFTPTSLGTRTASLAISDDANSDAGSATLTGVGIAGTLTITPLTSAFGKVLVGKISAAKTTTVKNSNKATLHIDAVVPSGEFTIASDSCSGNDLAAGAGCSIGAKFQPTQAGALSGSLSITDDGAHSPQTVTLTGTGTLSNPTFSPVSIGFGRVQIGSVSAAKAVKITNPNPVALDIASIITTGPFEIAANSCGSSISANGNCQVSVTFNPTTDSNPTGTAETGKLTVTDDGATASQSVSLSGTAFGAMATPTPAPTPTKTATPTPTKTITPTPTPTPTVVPFAGVSNIVTNQGHGVGKACDTTGDLPSSQFAQVSSDTAGQPCSENPGQGEPGQECDQNSVWNYVVRGHVTFGPPGSGSTATQVEVQTWIGGDGISCTGGATVTCTGSSTLVEDSTYPVGALNETIPFAAAESLLAPYQVSPGDGNLQKFYVFAQPIDGSVDCTANNYVTEEHN